jgi:hypothetical protein
MSSTIINCATNEVTVIQPTEEQAAADAWDNLRATRNAMLSGSDWTQVDDAPVDKAAWAAYRQELRDLPAKTTDPFNPVWPQKPQ